MYGNDVWTAFDGFAWVAVVACPLGAILGGLLYHLLYVHELMAEAIGTFILVTFGLGGVATQTLNA